MNDLHDGTYPGLCAGCERLIDGREWFWFADGGSVFLTFCQDCGEPDGFDKVTRAVAVELTDDETDETFDRAIELPAAWFGEDEKPPLDTFGSHTSVRHP